MVTVTFHWLFQQQFSQIKRRKSLSYVTNEDAAFTWLQIFVHFSSSALVNVHSHPNFVPIKAATQISCNKAARRKLKYIMFLSSKLNTNPQFPLEMGVCVCVCMCVRVCS